MADKEKTEPKTNEEAFVELREALDDLLDATLGNPRLLIRVMIIATIGTYVTMKLLGRW